MKRTEKQRAALIRNSTIRDLRMIYSRVNYFSDWSSVGPFTKKEKQNILTYIDNALVRLKAEKHSTRIDRERLKEWVDRSF